MGSDPLSLVLTAYLALAVVMMGLWVLQLRVRNASIADVGWCAGLIAVVLWYATQATGETERKLLVAVLAVLYAGRLGFYILLNRVIGKTEDARYRRLREQWGSSEPVRMFGYFQLQALAVMAFSLPFLVLIQNPRPPFALIEFVGLLIWIVAVSGEAMADLAARAIPIHVVESRPGLSRWTLALLTPSELFLRMVALVGLRCHGSEHAWMVPDLDRPDRHGLGAPESHGHSPNGATGPREPGRGLSSLPTDDERILPMVSSGLAVNAERACYRDLASTNWQDNSSPT